MSEPLICVAILAKQKESMLPSWLESLSQWDYPKDRIALYVRANNSTDNTNAILTEWLDKNLQQYHSAHIDLSDVNQNIEQYGVHEWNATRFKILGEIREGSVNHAIWINADYYFVVDVDNFIKPDTLRKLVATNLPVVAPFLKCVDEEQPAYSNLHLLANVNGYYLDDMRYYQVVRQEITGLIVSDVVHCTYLIRKDVLPRVAYVDNTEDYEYVIFSRTLRKLGIPQYFDNREVYGYLSLRERVDELNKAMKELI